MSGINIHSISRLKVKLNQESNIELIVLREKVSELKIGSVAIKGIEPGEIKVFKMQAPYSKFVEQYNVTNNLMLTSIFLLKTNKRRLYVEYIG